MTMELSDPVFHDEEEARKYLEDIRWPDGAYCPFCGSPDAVKALGGVSMGAGWHHCGFCRKKFTVRVGSIFERSHVPLTKWLLAFRLMCSSKKGISAHQLHRTLDVTYKTAWFMEHRIREAMKAGAVFTPLSGIIEADETFIGKRRPKREKERGWDFKNKVVTLVERGGRARSVHVDELSRRNIEEIVTGLTDYKITRLMTDESGIYKRAGKRFKSHESVNHKAEEYVRGDVHTNSAEGFFSIFKRGMKGVYQHCSEKHLHRYLSEFDFRYSNRVALGVDDELRTARALKGAEGKRLTYRQPAKGP